MITLKYRGILNILTDEILSGKYALRGAFPGARFLVKRFGAARETVRKVLCLLEAQGLIYRHPGKPTVVTARSTGARPKIGVLYAGDEESEIFRTISLELERQSGSFKVEIIGGRSRPKSGAASSRTIYTAAKRMIAKGVRGVILHPTQNTTKSERMNHRLTELFRSAGIQVVLVGCDIVRRPRRSDFDLIGIDDFNAGRVVAEHVVANGAKKITFVARKGCSSEVLERLGGVQTMKVRVPVEVMALNSLSDFRQIARGLMDCGELDAIICQDDVAAMNVATVLRKMGIRMPTEVMLVGFGDALAAEKHHPGLTSIRHPCSEIARHSLRIMIERLSDPTMPPIRVLCREILVTRGSTDRDWR